MARVVKDLLKVVQAAAEDARNGTENFKANFFAPLITSNKRSGSFPIFGRTHQKRQSFVVPAAADAPRVGHDIDAVSYTCVTHRAADVLPYEEEDEDDTGLLSAATLAENIEEAMAIEREFEVAEYVTDTAKLTLNGSPTTKFDVPGGDAGEYVANIKLAVLAKINRMPLSMAATPDVAMYFQQLVAKMGYGSGHTSLPTYADVARFFQVNEFEIALAQYDKSKPGKTSDPDFMYGTKGFWLFRKPAGPKSPGFLATPYYPKLSKSRVKELGAPHTEGTFIEQRFCYKFTPIDVNACFYAYDVLQ